MGQQHLLLLGKMRPSFRSLLMKLKVDERSADAEAFLYPSNELKFDLCKPGLISCISSTHSFETTEAVSFSQMPSAGKMRVPRGDEPKLSNSRTERPDLGQALSVVPQNMGGHIIAGRRWEYCPLKTKEGRRCLHPRRHHSASIFLI